MNLTNNLRKWLSENRDVKADATDDEFRKAAGDALASGDLTAGKLTELTTDPAVGEANEFSKQMAELTSGIKELVELQRKPEAEQDGDKSESANGKSAVTTDDDTEPVSQLQKMVASMGGDGALGMIEPDGDKSPSIRVKDAVERYTHVKTAAIYPDFAKSGRPHPNAGKQMFDFHERGRAMDVPSQRERAVSGVYAKLLVSISRSGGSRNLGFQALNEHDKNVLCWGMENLEWGGSSDGTDEADIRGKLTELQQKQLIDDAVSGGIEAAPIVFDDDVIQTPLLHGELFPFVKVVPIDRGRRIEGVATGTVTGGWGGVDDTAIALFATAGYVTAFDTTIFRWEGAILIGLDFLSDTPIDFGAHVTSQYGDRLLEDLDDVIATGDGTTQPEGVMNGTGVTVIAFGGVTTLANYEALRFGVAKPEHRSDLMRTAVFCGTETSYRRAKAIPLAAADARRIFAGTSTNVGTYDDYAIMGRKYAINESLTNAQIFYAILGKYRMYRRRGLTIRTSVEGTTLIRANELLITATARYGGQIERGAIAAISTTGEV